MGPRSSTLTCTRDADRSTSMYGVMNGDPPVVRRGEAPRATSRSKLALRATAGEPPRPAAQRPMQYILSGSNLSWSPPWSERGSDASWHSGESGGGGAAGSLSLIGCEVLLEEGGCLRLTAPAAPPQAFLLQPPAEHLQAWLGALQRASRPLWTPDSAANSCAVCNGAFGRRHHCRHCGDLVCGACSKRRVHLPAIGYAGAKRVCDRCAANRCGQLGDHYRLGDVVSESASSEVLLAVPRGEGPARVAVKRSRDLARLRNEAAVLAAVAHPRILRVHQIFPAEGALVTDFFPGGDLRALLSERRPLAEDEAAAALGAVLEALAHMHAAGFMHRDVKAENVLLAARGEPGSAVLADCGFACRVDAIDPPACGTVRYLAPEVVARRAFSPAGDVWAVGVLAHVLLVGRGPFAGAGASDAEVLAEIRAVRAPPRLPQSLSEHARAFVEAALTVDVDARPSADRLRGHQFVMPVPAGRR